MSAPETVNLLIKARWIVPVVPENRVFENCALAIRGGVIQALVPQTEADKRFDAEQVINLGNHVLIPGLVLGLYGRKAGTAIRDLNYELVLFPPETVAVFNPDAPFALFFAGVMLLIIGGIGYFIQKIAR
jgi:hypothetical protein